MNDYSILCNHQAKQNFKIKINILGNNKDKHKSFKPAMLNLKRENPQKKKFDWHFFFNLKKYITFSQIEHPIFTGH